MSVIKITVNDQNLLITDAPRIAAQGVNENYIEFTFSEDWDGFGKTANFYRDTAPTVIYQSLVDQNGYAAIPHEITDNESWICIGLSGVKDDVVKTSEILKYKIVKGLYVVETSEPSPGIFEQILSKVGEVLTEQETFISEIEADQAAFKSETEADQAAFKSEISTEITEFETETSGNIADIDTRMDTFLAGQSTGAGLGTLRTETILFESDTPSRGTMIENNRRSLDIDDDIDNYDYIDIYYGAFEKYNVIRIKPSDVPAYVIPAVDEPLRWSANSIPEAGSSPNYRAEFTMRKFSDQNKLLFTFARWTIHTDSNYYTADDTTLANFGIGILRIIGIKYVPAGKDGELTDIRIGADGTIYPSAGAAVRGQISDLKEDLNVFRPTATAEDVGKALIVKTVADGVPTGFEYGEAGGADEEELALKVDKDGIDQVTAKNSAFFDKTISANLIDESKITDGIYVQKNGTISTGGYQATDYIPVTAGEKYCFSWWYNGAQKTDAHLRFFACYDADKNVIASAGSDVGINSYPITIAEGVAFVRLSFSNNTNYSKYQFEHSETITPYMAYGAVADVLIKREYLPDTPVDISDIPAFELVTGCNLLDPNDDDYVDGGFLETGGTVSQNGSYITSGYIAVNEGDRVIASYTKDNGGGQVTLRTVACYSDSKAVLNTKGVYSVNYFDVPSGVSYIRICYAKGSFGYNVSVQVVAWGESYKGYTPYENPHYQLSPNYMFPVPSAPKHVYLPAEIYVAVGRTIELYNEQIVLDYEKYHFQWICAKGSAYKRKFSITGQAAQNLNLTLNLYDDDMNLCWVGRSVIHVVSASNPVKKILPIGDSLTNWKAWLQETILLSSGNITFVGTRFSGQSVDSEGNIYPRGDIHSEGRSGWGASEYLANSVYDFDDRYDGVGSVSGTANPFWDGSKFSLSHYLTTQTGIDTPDAVQIFLGTNDITAGVDTAVSNIVSMVNTIRTEYPNLPIFVCNTIYRSNQNGYGSTGSDAYASGGSAGSWQYDQDVKVMDLAVSLVKALEKVSGVYFIPLISCMDREYSFGQVATQVNPRCAVTVDMPVESVHPQACGYYQMADLMYSTYCGILS